MITALISKAGIDIGGLELEEVAVAPAQSKSRKESSSPTRNTATSDQIGTPRTPVIPYRPDAQSRSPSPDRRQREEKFDGLDSTLRSFLMAFGKSMLNKTATKKMMVKTKGKNLDTHVKA